MTSFKGAIVKKTLEEWEDEAIDAIESTGHSPQVLAVTGMGAGVLVAGLSPISFLGLIPFAWGIKAAIQVNNTRSRMEAAIEAGAYAAVLPMDQLKEYAKQFGMEQTIAQIDWAKRAGVPLSEASQTLLIRYQQKYKGLPTVPEPTTQTVEVDSVPVNDAIALPERQTVGVATQLGAIDTTATEIADESWVDRSDLPVATTKAAHPVDYLIGNRLRTSLIVSVSGGGKDMLFSNALRSFLAKHHGFKVIVMDCKDDPKEVGYYAGLPGVKVHRMNVAIASDGEVVEWVDRCIDEFLKLPERALLICNESTLIRAKSPRYVATVDGLVSSGDSREKYSWESGQSAHTDDLKINGAARSRFRLLIIGLQGEELQVEAVLAAKCVADSARNMADVRGQLGRSPVNRAWCDGLRWHPMPELENYSGYNRDTRSPVIKSTVTPEDTRAQLEDLYQRDVTSEPLPNFPEAPEARKPPSQNSEGAGSTEEVDFQRSEDFRKYFPQAPREVESVLFRAYILALEAGKRKQDFIADFLQGGTGGRRYQAAVKYLDYLEAKYKS